MAYEHVETLGVYAWGEFVGAVAASPRARDSYAFQYDDAWASGGRQLAPLLMPHRRGRGTAGRTFVFPVSEYNAVTFKGLPPMLADSLPDAFGNTLIDAALRARGLDRPSAGITPLDRLAYMGQRTMGALTFEPADDRPVAPTALDLRAVVEKARHAVRGELSTDDAANHALVDLLQVGTSAGGARPKAVIAWNRSTGEMRAGNLPVGEPGFEQWLLKFDGVDKGSTNMSEPLAFTRIEHAYYLMAERAGLDVPETTLLREGGRRHFLIKRFDRDEESRLHAQSLCGLAGFDFNLDPQAGGGNRYEDYFDTIARLGIDSDEARSEAFRRLVFNVLASNNDDHTKNFGFLMDAAGTWSLSPAYDLTFAYDPRNIWLRQHLMSVRGKRDDITKRDLWDFADTYRVPDVAGTISAVADAVSTWVDCAREADVPTGDIARVQERLDAVAGAAGTAKKAYSLGPGAKSVREVVGPGEGVVSCGKPCGPRHAPCILARDHGGRCRSTTGR